MASSIARSLTSTPVTVAPGRPRRCAAPITPYPQPRSRIRPAAGGSVSRNRTAVPRSRRPRRRRPPADERRARDPRPRTERLALERHRRVGGEVVLTPWRPRHPRPGLHGPRRQFLVGRVGDLLEGQPVRVHDRDAGPARLPAQDLVRPSRPAGAPRRRRSGSRPASAPCCGRTRRPAPSPTTSPPVRPRPGQVAAGCGSSSRPRAACRRTRSRARPMSSSERRVHRCEVERPWPGQHVERVNGSTSLGPVGDPVGVAPPQRPEPGVEACRRLARPADAHVRRQHAVEPALGAASGRGRATSGDVEVRDLAAGCTPASVRPAHTTSTDGSRRTVASAASSSPWTVRSPGWVAQPWNSVPS